MKKVIAVDGPAGAGKSTVSKIAATRLGLKFLNSGQPFTENFLAEITRDIDIKLDDKAKVFLDGVDVTKEIRTPEVSKLASDVSKYGFVRKKLTDLQREMATEGAVIMDGRDIGTQVLPNADVKIFLTATLDERARRRFEELKAKGQSVTLDAIKLEIAARDKQDSEREIAPLKQADDAILIDSTGLTVDEVVAKILELAS